MTVAQKFIAFNQPDLGEEEMSAVMDVIRSGWIGTGKIAHQFEEEFSEFVGGGYCVAVSSCTMGLQLALHTQKMDSLSEVIVPTLTFAATLNAVISSGAQPILVDIDRSGCMDIKQANQAVGEFTKAVIPVHFSGSPCQIGKLDSNLFVIEDCAHMVGGLLTNIGDIKVFSFYANKNITSGEGGMVVCKDKKLADEIRILSAQGLSKGAWARYGNGQPKSYSVEKIGFKGNLPDILAAIGLVQLRRWPEMRKKRHEIFKIYETAFGDKGVGHSTHFYPLRVKNRDALRLKLHQKGIGTGIHYKPLHLEPAYKSFGYVKGDFPNAEAWGQEELSLPVSSTMSPIDALKIVEIIKGELK